MSLYRIKGWTENFEGAKSKGYDNKTKCQMPTKHGLGYKKLVRMKNGPALFGAWCALIQVVSRHPKPRYGYLTDTGGIPHGYHAEPEIKEEYSKQNRPESAQPYQPEDLEIMTDIPAKIFEELLKVASVNIGWLEVYEATDTTGIPQGYHRDTTVSAQYPPNSDLDLDSDSDSDSKPKRARDSSSFQNLIPASLQTETFQTAWAAWVANRTEIKKSMTERAAGMVLTKMESMGEARAIAAINHSILQGYQGLYEPESSTGKGFIAATGNTLNPPWSAYKNGT